MMTFPTEWKNKIHVPNHQPDMVIYHEMRVCTRILMAFEENIDGFAPTLGEDMNDQPLDVYVEVLNLETNPSLAGINIWRTIFR